MKKINKILAFILGICVILSFCSCNDNIDADIEYEKAEQYFKNQDFASTINTIKVVIDDNLTLKKYKSKEANMYYMIGYSYWQLKRFDTAIPYMEKANELDETNEEYKQVMGRLYYIVKEFDKSRKCYEAVLKLNDKNEKAYYNLGLICLKQTPMDTKKAKEYFNKAIDLYPEYAMAYAGMSMAYYFEDNKEKTNYFLNKAIKYGFNDLPIIKKIQNGELNEV